ncbi:PREDICTED: probable RNA helicase armi [Polistes dominula]|uniref:RNA helicase n=1 Tax=Polistes dominula TaxID=743375 RepID=A0ABM1IWZ7_POLDO|nr:PREDICTED: probable RNA helicase armi [Polistes dominula]XP_015184744.1 PREDICTED: probable RNA helicase armi [Polistes dominula]
MLSLMYTLINNVWGNKNSSQPEDDINTIISQIENITSTNILLSENTEKYNEETYNGKGCYYTTGTVTCVKEDYILINNHSICDTINIQTKRPKVGDKVYYLAYKKSEDDEEKICKIISVMEESWDDSVITSQERIMKIDIFTRNIIGKVIKRVGRIVFINPGNIYFDLNKINSEFVPIVGDWLQLEALVEVNDNNTDLTGEILEINKIQALRLTVDIDNITNYDPINQCGTIGKNTFFYKAACESGYVPYVGDKVVSDSIESDQGIYSWRSLNVAPLMEVPDKPKELPTLESFKAFLPQHTNLDALIKDKYGIIITNNLKINVNLEEEKDIFVEIHNTSPDIHTLCQGTFMSMKAQSQLSLIWPQKRETIDLNPSQIISYQFKCNPKFVGTSEELFIFHFKGFQIGRVFTITVNPKNIKSQKRQNYKKDNYVRRDRDDKAVYIPGIRPYKPSVPFKTRTLSFKIPQRFWDVIMENYHKPPNEYELAIGNEIPCLAQRLSFEIYKDRFHALLYLEEIEQNFNLNKYDMECATMRPYKDYLCLQVLGLAEKRPSLLIGDKAIISCNWHKNQGKVKYEGYIHKVTNTEIFLKFNKQFHEMYNNEICHVSFKTSTAVMNRCHNAVNLAVLHLGSDFLFPTRIIEKCPQIILDEIDTEEKKPHVKRKLKRYESISSISSSTTSDSSDTIKSLPRMSVAERLFKVKPVEQSKNITEHPNLATVDRATDNHTKSNTNFENNKDNDININKDKDNNKDTLDLSVTPNSPITSNDLKLDEYFSKIKKQKLNWFNKKLNYYQKEAIKNILKGLARPLPYVIFGPPGTGKSVTLCETILQLLTILPNSRLLVATPSNSSANLMLERLLDSNILKPGDVVRLIAQHCLDDGSIPSQLLPYCTTVNLGLEGPLDQSESFNRKTNIVDTTIGRHRITIATCSALGALFNVKFPRNHFSHVLIDEAGQATEPEIMIPLSFIHADYGQAILAGDPLQLGPVVQSRLAKHFGFEESFLSRILHQFPYQRDPEGFETGYDPRLVTRLVMNYRSLPEILELPNSLFYNSELQPKISCKNSDEANLLRLLSEALPEREGLLPPAILFHGVKGENLRDNDSPSWYNLEEATQVYLYLSRFYKYGLTADDIGIITPYQKQVMQIRQLLSELNIECPKVSSVEGFQGQERKIIILSTVRSSTNFIKEDIRHALGFVASPKRLNVAITRARALLIILGNPELLAEDPYWRSILIYCLDRNAYTGCNFFPFHLDNSFGSLDKILVEI